MVRMLKKQKQLLRMEIEEYKSLKSIGKRGIHPFDYYKKLGNAWFHLDKAQKSLEKLENDVFEGFNYTEN